MVADLPAAEPARCSPAAQGPAGTILLVDDDTSVRRLMARWLSDDGYQCLQAKDAETACQCLQQNSLQLVTVDLQLPGRPGTELLAQIVKQDPELPVIVLTAVTDRKTVVSMIQMGAWGYLVKPVEREELLVQVAGALARRREIAERRRAQQQLEALNQTLEQRVEERTRQLEASRKAAFDNLRAAQQARQRAEAAHAALKQQARELAESNARLEQEIGERRRVEKALREREARMRAIVETAADGIMTFDEQGQIESLNPAASRIFGYDPPEVIGRNLAMLIPPKTTVPPLQYLEEHLGIGPEPIGNLARELEGRTRDGTVFPLQLTIGEFRSDGRRLFTAILRDLTEHKQLQCELAQAQKLESVGQLAAGIAHEINTPTQYVGDNVRFLRDAFDDLHRALDALEELRAAAAGGGPVDPALIEAAQRAVEEADLPYLRDEIPQAIQQSLDGVDRIASIVRAMKEFSHPGTDEKTLVDLAAAIQTTITVARNEWKYVAEVKTDFDPELPSVPCLPGELNQVLLNLIVNAAHAIGDVVGENATEKGTITIRTRLNDPWAEIYISDTGSGIPEHVRSRIFDPFFTTKEVGKGTGQGLAIARSVVVDKHGGTIDFDTETGKGTTFRIRLPLVEPSSGEKDHDHANNSEEAYSVCG